jgi:hypothetical protein
LSPALDALLHAVGVFGVVLVAAAQVPYLLQRRPSEHRDTSQVKPVPRPARPMADAPRAVAVSDAADDDEPEGPPHWAC